MMLRFGTLNTSLGNILDQASTKCSQIQHFNVTNAPTIIFPANDVIVI